MEEVKVTVEQIVKKAAKRLDAVLCKHKRANGQVTAANFSVVGKNVTLQGAELKKVGTGYGCKGETLEERVNSLVDAIESDLEIVASRAKKAEGKKPEAPKTPSEPEGQIGATIDHQQEGQVEEAKNVEEEIKTDKPVSKYSSLGFKELKEIAKAKQIKVKVGTSAAKLVEILDEADKK